MFNKSESMFREGRVILESQMYSNPSFNTVLAQRGLRIRILIYEFVLTELPVSTWVYV